jgi:23S rRNA G2445 N2-methylase RlmL
MPHTPLTPAARLRALKRHVWLGRHGFLATSAPGLESLVAEEVARLPEVATVDARTGAVAFEAPFDTVYPALLRLRVAESLRVFLAQGVAAGSFPMLFDQLQRVRWALWLPASCAVTVRVRSSKSRLRDDAGLERTLRRALLAGGVDAGDGHVGRDAADGDASAAAPVTLHLHLHHDRASVALDAGGALHRRQGDKWVSPTTIRETTAAALVRLAGVADPPGEPDLLCDPFCGSGTLVAEALDALSGAAAGRARGGDALAVPLAASPAWKPERWAHARRLHGGPGALAETPMVLASDADAAAVRAANHNLAALGYGPRARAEVASAQSLDLAALATERGARRPLLLTNPPYGRLAGARGAAPTELLRGLLASATGWRFALLYPRPNDLEGVAGVELLEVRTIVTGGLRNAVLVGRVNEPGG